jgi:predicted house-cleaning noncanonical NTP pyrophosphatase (MazG superfamily)
MKKNKIINFFHEFVEDYPKLIRDKIPEQIIINEGRAAHIKIGTKDKEIISILKKKIVEESMELYTCQSKKDIMSGIADIEEIINTLKYKLNITTISLNKIRKNKNLKSGSFDKFLILVSK